MDWFLYDNDLRHERVKVINLIHLLVNTYSKSIIKAPGQYP